MNDKLTAPQTGRKRGLAGLGIAAFAVVCCAGLPLLAGLLGGIALGSVLGVGVGALAVVIVSVIVARGRRQRACAPPDVAMRHGGES
ncbi:MAG: hypothetical protein LC790_09220 [Actinobacteria bacterium]|nr:hypothetical protein [Actinomycetota bacterium]